MLFYSGDACGKKPRSQAHQKYLPRVIASLDRPTDTGYIWPLEQITINDGWHVHAIVLIRPNSRLDTGLRKHIKDNRRTYIHEYTRIRTIHVRRIKTVSEYVTDYALKCTKRDSVLADDLLILPKSLTEATAKERISN